MPASLYCVKNELINQGAHMKGMIFTEFLEMVEAKFSADMVDDIIADSDLPHGGPRWAMAFV